MLHILRFRERFLGSDLKLEKSKDNLLSSSPAPLYFFNLTYLLLAHLPPLISSLASRTDPICVNFERPNA